MGCELHTLRWYLSMDGRFITVLKCDEHDSVMAAVGTITVTNETVPETMIVSAVDTAAGNLGAQVPQVPDLQVPDVFRQIFEIGDLPGEF